MQILLTGASGFLGKSTFELLVNSGFEVITAGRRETESIKIDLTKESLSSLKNKGSTLIRGVNAIRYQVSGVTGQLTVDAG